MGANISELRLPADPRYILVAKRAAISFAALAGFSPEVIDDLAIATAQACENALACQNQSRPGGGQLHLLFLLDPCGLEIRVRGCSPKPLRSASPLLNYPLSPPSRPETPHLNLALRLMGLFVDDSSYRRNPRTGNLHIRLVKHLTL